MKRYVPETGHTWIQSLCRTKPGRILLIAEITVVEVMASLGRMSRDQPPRLNLSDRTRISTLFQRHARHQYSVTPVTPKIFAHAGDLCFVHPLRAYDAVQLACALQARDELQAAGLGGPIFVSADKALLAFAQNEDLLTENPNEHP